MILRPATVHDAAFLFLLRTDPAAAAASIGPPPTFESHMDWVCRAVLDESRRLYIAEKEKRPVGTARLDFLGLGVAEVSITVAASDRRQRVGQAILALLDEKAEGLGLKNLVATIRPENRASMNLFRRAGYEPFEDGKWRKAI